MKGRVGEVWEGPDDSKRVYLVIAAPRDLGSFLEHRVADLLSGELRCLYEDSNLAWERALNFKRIA